MFVNTLHNRMNRNSPDVVGFKCVTLSLHYSAVVQLVVGN